MDNYTPEALAARMKQHGEALGAELEKDGKVRETRAALEQAQNRLEQARAHKGAIPYLPGSKSAMRDWHGAVEAVTQAKAAVEQAQKAFNVAQNSAAAARWAARLQAEETQRQEQRDQAQNSAAMLEELNAKEQFLPAWVAAGGTEATFEQAWSGPGGLWQEELKRRAAAVLAAQRRNSRSANAF